MGVEGRKSGQMKDRSGLLKCFNGFSNTSAQRQALSLCMDKIGTLKPKMV